jgi:hypothetical protein
MRFLPDMTTWRLARLAGILAASIASTPAFSQSAPTTETHDHGAGAAQDQPHGRAPVPADAYVYIGWPIEGAVVRSTHVKVWFGTRNFGVAPAGTFKPNTGHHHLLIDTDPPNMNEPIPNDKNHLHFGVGQTETVIDLTPGTHTLQLLMGDGNHVPHERPLMSKRITIYVRPG